MKPIITLLLIASLACTSLAQQNQVSQPRAAAPPLLSSALCGKGMFLFTLQGRSIGSETFEVRCETAGGFSASGHLLMRLPLGGNLDMNTTIELDRMAVPTKFTAKGVSVNQSVDQSITFNQGRAKISNNNASSEIPYANGSAFLMPGVVNYLFEFVAARYDTVRGGVQQVSIFPNLLASIERTAHDEVRAIGITAATKPTGFERYTMKLSGAALIFWADERGRVVLISVPAQNFQAVREEYALFAEPLRATLRGTDFVPDYSAPPGAPFTAEEVRIKVKNYHLAGTLLLPKNARPPFPALVMSTGSGQQTRDEPVPIEGLEKYRPFRQIAEALAARGIAVLRVDDRGVGDSTGIETLARATTFDFARDVRAQISYLRTRRDIDPRRIAIAGHSEGGIIAPLIAASDRRVRAIVIMAGTARRGEEVLLYQLDRPFNNNPNLPETERAREQDRNRAFIRALIEGRDVSSYPASYQALNFPWTRAFLTYDPLPTMRHVRQPVLILQGAVDRQVTAEQAEMLAQAAHDAGNRDVTLRLFPNLNHLFLPATTGEASEYSTLRVTSIPEEVINVLADWLQKRLKAGAQ